MFRQKSLNLFGANSGTAPLAATGAVTDVALQQGSAEDVAGFGQLRQEPVALADDLLLIH